MDAEDQTASRFVAGSLNAGYLPDNSPAIQRLSLTLYRLLARGRPVAPSDLAALLESDEPGIETLLSALPPSVLDRDENGAIMAFVGLSLSPTRHRFELGAQTLFTWCVLDALFLPEILDQEARVATHCPASDTPIVLRVAPDHVVDVEPPAAVMSVVAPEIAACQDDLRGAFCSHVNFFAGRDSFERWTRDRSGTRCVTIAEAFDLGQQRNQARFPDVSLGDS